MRIGENHCNCRKCREWWEPTHDGPCVYAYERKEPDQVQPEGKMPLYKLVIVGLVLSAAVYGVYAVVGCHFIAKFW